MNGRNQAEFEVVGETDDYLAVNKPAGLLVHPTKPDGPRTLWDGLRDLLGYELATGGQVSLINRLDRETSGLVLVAKSSPAARAAGRALQRGEFEKDYLAVVFGWPEWDRTTIDTPIIRQGEVQESAVWLKRTVHPAGQPAQTVCAVVARHQRADGKKFSIVQASPLTGRTHQIRVHLAHAGHPVVGDKLYADGEHWYLRFIDQGWTPEMQTHLWHPRHALHATRLRFTLDGTAHDWSAPVPADLAEFF